MGSPGVKIAIAKKTIIKAITTAKGRVTAAAKCLRIHPSTLKKRIDADPELRGLLHSLRQEYELMVLDEAEDTLMYALENRKKDLSNACRTAQYVLNHRGTSRGYNKIEHISATEEDIARHNALMKQLRDIQEKNEN
jgi:hypothetical protein